MLQNAVGCTTTMPIAGCPSESDIGLWQSIAAVVPARAGVVPDGQTPAAIVPAIAAVVPAVAPATAVVPARQTIAAVVPAAAVVVPPCQLLLGVDLHERAAFLGGLCSGIRDGLANRLEALGSRRKQGSQSTNRTAVLGHVRSPSWRRYVSQTRNTLANEKSESVRQDAGVGAAVQPILIDPHAMKVAVACRLRHGGLDGKAQRAQHG